MIPILWRSAVVTTVSPGHVHCCMHLVSRIHLKVWMLIVPTCDWWQVASAANSILKSAAHSPFFGRMNRLLEELRGISIKRWLKTAWRTIGRSEKNVVIEDDWTCEVSNYSCLSRTEKPHFLEGAVPQSVKQVNIPLMKLNQMYKKKIQKALLPCLG